MGDPPEGFYCRYLRQLGERRAAEGNPSPDIAPPEYWEGRRRKEALKQEQQRPSLKLAKLTNTMKTRAAAELISNT